MRFDHAQTTFLTPVVVFPRFSPSLARGISARNISSVSGFVPARGEPEECPVEREFVPFSRPENRVVRSERRNAHAQHSMHLQNQARCS